MISAIAWVPCGIAKRVPLRYEPTEEEVKQAQGEFIEKVTVSQTADENLDEETKAVVEEFGLENYDEEDEGIHIYGAGMDVAGVQYHEAEGGDPYITFQGDDSDEENFMIEPTDALVLSAYTDEDVSMLQVHVYETLEDNLYIHHDILLPSFPLSLAQLDANPSNPSQKGNYVAIGTFGPGIELWDLDVVDSFEPAFILGGELSPEDVPSSSAPKSKGKKKSKKIPKSVLKPGSHSDAVMSLSWNRHQRNMLASGSADKTIKLWDISTQNCALTLNHHQDKVQSVSWHSVEQAILLSGSFDKTVCVADCRSPDSVGRWTGTADVESLAWNPHSPEQFLVSFEDGTVTLYDARKPGASPLFTLSAHNQAVSSISINPTIPGMLVTSSIDKHIKVWDILDNRPTCVFSRELDMGSIFSVSFCPNNPFCIAMGGEKRGARVWDSSENGEVWRRFSSRTDTTKVTQRQADAMDSLQKMSMVDENSDDSDHEDVAGHKPKAPKDTKNKSKPKKKVKVKRA